MLILIRLYLIALIPLIQGIRKHHFPKTGLKGEQIANEFQLIETSNSFVSTTSNSNGVAPSLVFYEITNVYPRVISNDGVVNVTYETNNASSSDWIGAYSPPVSAHLLHTTSPVKYGWCDEASTYLSHGVGNLLFNLTNLRASVVFYYFKGGTKSPIVANSSYPSFNVSFRNINEPLRPRVIPTGDENIFNLLWSSAYSTQPILKWGTTSGNYLYSDKARTSNISRSSLCGSPANTTGINFQIYSITFFIYKIILHVISFLPFQ